LSRNRRHSRLTTLCVGITVDVDGPSWSVQSALSTWPGLSGIGRAGAGWAGCRWYGSGRGSQSGDLVPDGESSGHFGAIVIGGEPMAAGPEMRADHAEHRQEPVGGAGGAEALHGASAVPGRLMRVLRPVEFSTDVKCCDESGGRLMLVAERAMPWSAWRLLSWHARSARCVVGVCGG